jgi:septal ring factor EnvC (AmiA/AmiB activator)
MNALENNETGTLNTAIGFDAGVSTSNKNLTNTTAIGNGARVTADNTIQLGNTAVTTIGGQVAWTAASDSRIKKNIVNSNYGLATVLKLRPVEYNLISNDLRQVGFIAQEVQKLVPEVVTGKEGDLSKGEILGITYSNLVPVLTKAIQEQQKQIEDQNAKIAAQQKQIEELIKLMKELKK